MSLKKIGKLKPKLAATWTAVETVMVEEFALQALAGVGDDSRHHRSVLDFALHLRRPTNEDERAVLGIQNVHEIKP